MRSRSTALLLALILAPITMSVSTCQESGGGGSQLAVVEIEPNSISLQANTLTLDRTLKGDVREPLDTDIDGELDSSDIDWFIIRLIGGRTVKVELFASRRDQAGWNAAGIVPRLTVFYPFDNTKILDHSFENGWSFAPQDFDFPLFRVPFTGFYRFKITPDVPDTDPPTISPGGSYYLRVGYTTPLTSQTEVELDLDTGVNDTPGTAQPISPGTLAGYHRDGNSDCFSIQVATPRVIRAEVLAQRNGAWKNEIGTFDPLLRLYDVDGTTVLAESDDAFFADPAIQHEVVGGGRYVLEVTSALPTSPDAPYVLSIDSDPAQSTSESEPNDAIGTADALGYVQSVAGTIDAGEEDWFRFTGTAGDMVRLQVFDAATSEAATAPIDVALFLSDGTTPLPFDRGTEFQVLNTILPQTAGYYVRVGPDLTTPAPTSYRLELQRFLAATIETEPNGTVATADPSPGISAMGGAISVPGDVDLFRVLVANGQLAVFEVYAAKSTGTDGFAEYSGQGSDLAPVLTLRDETGAIVATSTSVPPNGIYAQGIRDGLATVSLAWVGSPTNQVLYLEVAAADGTGGAAHTYVVRRR